MCLARLRLLEGSQREAVQMEDVACVEATKARLVVTGLMGETRTIEGVIKSIDFVESVVIVARGKD